jgi:hypothetical protein
MKFHRMILIGSSVFYVTYVYPLSATDLTYLWPVAIDVTFR